MDNAADMNVYVTAAGNVLTDTDMQTLASEAERGYDVCGLAPVSGEHEQMQVAPGRMSSEFERIVEQHAAAGRTSVSEISRATLQVLFDG